VEGGEGRSVAQAHTFSRQRTKIIFFNKNKCLQNGAAISEASSQALSGRLRWLYFAAEAVKEPLSFNRLVAIPPPRVRTNPIPCVALRRSPRVALARNRVPTGPIAEITANFLCSCTLQPVAE
jgi:hypothetical protein